MRQSRTLCSTRSLVAALVALALVGCGEKDSQPQSSKEESSTSLQQKAEAGDAAAQYEFGLSLSSGEKPDYKAAFPWLMKAAEAGNADAMYLVYFLYRDGAGTRIDSDAADRWLSRAAALDNANALSLKAINHGECYRGKAIVSGNSSDERERNILEMVRLDEKAAGKGDTSSQGRLGACYLFGITEGKNTVIPQDHAKAIPLLKASAENGNALAQWMLGVTYQFGFGGTSADVDQAKIWWDKLELQKNSFQQRQIANVYRVEDKKTYATGKNKWRDRKLTFEESNLIAYEWLEKAAAQGDISALKELSAIYRYGKRKEDGVKAFEYQLKAAELGDSEAQFSVALNYLLGVSVAKNYSAYIKWLERVVNNSSVSANTMAVAQFSLGETYYQGLGISQNLVLAYAWLNLAMANGVGSPEIQKALERMHREAERMLTPEQLNEAQQLSANWKQGHPMRAADKQAAGPVENAPAKLDTPATTLKKALSGSAIVISQQGKLLTNQHVVNECKEIRIPVANKNASLVLADKANDLALLQVEGDAMLPGTVPAVFADESSVRQGEDIVTFGFPLDGYLPTSGNITQGIISALAGPFNNSSVLQITAPIQQGNSGGPVLNMKGQVVGVVIGKADAVKLTKATGDIPQNINFAISGRVVKGFFEGNSIAYDKPGLFTLSKDSVALADLSKKTTVKVECWK